MTRTILTNVRVISAGENLTPDASGRPQRVPVVTLLVTPEDAEVLTLGSAGGRLQLVLRNTRDEGNPDTPGIVERELFSSGRPPKPAPRPVSRSAPSPVVMIAPPPPSEIEVYRGNRKSVESFDGMRD
jgi:pilus assembly protein CpaB